MAKLKLAPSILSADFGRLADEVRAVNDAGADLIHVDVMDGHYVPNLTLGPCIVSAAKKASQCPIDVHLMITNAEEHLDAYIDAGADLLSVHVEAVKHLHRTVQYIKGRGIKASVALNPATPHQSLDYVLDDLDMVLVMSVNPGFGGQSFIESSLQKIEAIRKKAEGRGLDIDIQVDGGVKVDNIARVLSAGANVVVSGSGIFKTDDYTKTMQAMRLAASET